MSRWAAGRSRGCGRTWAPAPWPPWASASGWRQPGSLAHACRLDDNAGMAGDDSGDRLLRRLLLLGVLDGVRPSGIPGWVSPVVPVVTHAAVGAGHWAAGRRRRALAAWASAAGFALVAWGLGTETPTRAEWQENIEQHKDLWRERGLEVPATAPRTETWMDRHQPWWNALSALASCNKVVFGVHRLNRSGNSRPAAATAITEHRETAEGPRSAGDYQGPVLGPAAARQPLIRWGVLDLVELALDDAGQAGLVRGGEAGHGPLEQLSCLPVPGRKHPGRPLGQAAPGQGRHGLDHEAQSPTMTVNRRQVCSGATAGGLTLTCRTE